MKGKRLLSALLALVMTLLLLPTGIALAETYSARIERTGDEYLSLQEAIDAAQSGDTITLLRTRAEVITIPAGLTLTIDLNGFSVWNSSDNAGELGNGVNNDVVSNHGNLTLKNGSVMPRRSAYYAIMNYPEGRITLNNVTINAARKANSFIVMNLGEMIINAGTTISKNNTSGVTCVQNGWYTGTEVYVVDYNRNAEHHDGQIAKMTINGGTFSSIGGPTLRNYSWAEMTINNATVNVETKHACLLNYDKATINGGTFVTTENCCISNSGLEDDMRGFMTINGGTFRASKTGLLYNRSIFVDTDVGHGVMTITGGTFERTDTDIGQLLYSYGVNGITAEMTVGAQAYITGGIFKGSINADENILYSKVEAKKLSDDPYSGPFFNVPVDQQLVVEGQHCTVDEKKTASDGNQYFYLVDDDAEQLVTLDGVRYAYNLSLEDSILINERIFFPQSNSYDFEAFKVQSYFGGTTTTTALNDSLKTEDMTIGGVTYTVYRVPVADCFAKQMTDEAIVTFTYHDKQVANDAGTAPRQYVVSIRSYCEDQIGRANSAAKLKTLCRAVLTYGAWAQLRFDYKTDDLAIRDEKYMVEEPSTEIPVSYEKKPAEGSCSAVRGAAISLVLESKTLMNFYIMPASGYTADDIINTITVKHGDAAAANYTKTKVTSGSMNGAVLVTVYGIMAKYLADEYAVSVGNETWGVKTWYQSPMNYAYDAQTTKPAEKDLVLALYDYYLAASAYLQ